MPKAHTEVRDPGLHVCYSHSLDLLCDRLTGILKDPLEDPLEPEWIVVQSTAIIRWLSLELARRLGICANIEFLLPNRFVTKVGGLLFPEKTSEIRMAEREVVAWRIFDHLRSLEESEGFDQVRNYIQTGNPEMRRLQLSEQIAVLFDQYPVYRPDWVIEWEGGGGEGWQPALWREVAADAFHPARMLQALQKRSLAKAALPSRVTVFGTSSLPRFHVHLLCALSQKSEVSFLVNRPASGSWSDQPTKREAERARKRALEQGRDPDSLYLEIGNRMVAAFGKSGRDFASILEEIEWTSEDEIGDPPARDSLLGRLQRQIYNQEETPASDACELISERDLSLQIHGCHSEMRELEVLWDYLVECFERVPGLKPSDIVVMSPRLELYTPLIPAVFARSSTKDLNRREAEIPYAIADRSSSEEFDSVRVLLWLWELVESRFFTRDVMRVIASRPVRERYRIAQEDLDLMRDWLSATRVRWGASLEHREKLGFAGLEGNTWKDGLNRLLLGYAMGEHGSALFGGILPYDAVEGSDADALAKLLEAFGEICKATGDLDGARSVEAWRDKILGVVDRLFDTGEVTQGGLRILRRTLTEMVEEARLAGVSEAQIGSTAMHRAVSRRLSGPSGASGYLSGGVTFCELRPLRSVPFRIVCVLGMNDTAFPRQDRRPRFDLMRENPRRGDRSVREDDRYLFLETIMAARESLFLSYLSRSVKDNSEMSPSIVINELVEYLGTHFTGPGVNRETLVTQHRLHGFHPDYFSGDARLFSYSMELCKGAMALRSPRRTARPFYSRVFDEPQGETWKNLSLERYLRFFRDPCQALIQTRLGVSLRVEEDQDPESEPFETDGLDGYLLKEQMVAEALTAERDPLSMEPYAKALGVLPPGGPGDGVFEDLTKASQGYVTRLNSLLAGAAPVHHDFQQEFEGIRVSGRLKLYGNDRQIIARCGAVRPVDRLFGWIRHLIAGAVLAPMETIVVGEDKVARYARLEQQTCREALDRLAGIYRSGLRAPLPFFAELSMIYLEARNKGSMARAEVWMDKLGKMRKIEYVSRCFGPEMPLHPDFDPLAREILAPLLANETLEAGN